MIRVFINYLLIICIGMMKLANAQDQEQQTPTSSNLQPSLLVVIALLLFMFTLTSFLLIYAKFCHRRAPAIHNVSQNSNSNDMFGNTTRFSGIDKKVVESLPFIKFSSLKGAKHDLQCAVCLTEFEEVEVLRLLPKCKHGFHIECVDLWLEHHSTCPLCRQIVCVEDLLTFTGSSSMRFLTGGQKSDNAGDDDDVSSTSFELFLEHENSVQRSSSRLFILGANLRKILTGVENDQEKSVLMHSLNHQIVASTNVMIQNRWSDVSSSDLMHLNSNVLGIIMSNDNRSISISSPDLLSDRNFLTVEYTAGCNKNQSNIVNSKEENQEMMGKRMFKDRIDQINGSNSNSRLDIELGFEDSSETRMKPAYKRSMSDITAGFKNLMSLKNDKFRQCLTDSEAINDSDNDDDYVREDLIKRREKWFEIAKKTVQWFREKNRSQELQQHQQTTQDKSQILLDV